MRFNRIAWLASAIALPGFAPAALAQLAPAEAQRGADNPADYEWIDRADSLWEAIGDAPPDYSFTFEDAAPWAWRTGDGHVIIVEDAGDNGIRSYYFEPGQDAPFLAVEPGASFGYDEDGRAMVYGPDGGPLAREDWGQWREQADALLDRAHDLFVAMRGEPQEAIDTEAWVDASPYIFGFIQLWDEGKRRHPGWQRHRSRYDWIAWRNRLEAERLRRRGLADAFNRWRQGGYHGTPGGRWNRPGEWHGRNQPGRGHGRDHDGRGDGRPGWHGRPAQPGAQPPRPAQPPRTDPTDQARPHDRPNGRPDIGPGRPRPGEAGRGGWPNRRRDGAPAPAPSPSPTPQPAAPTAQPAAPAPTPRPDRGRWTRGGDGGAPGATTRPERPRWQRPAPTPDAAQPVSRPAYVPRPQPQMQQPRPQPSAQPQPRPQPSQGWSRPSPPPSSSSGSSAPRPAPSRPAPSRPAPKFSPNNDSQRVD